MSQSLIVLVLVSSGCGSSAPELGPEVQDPARRAYYDGMRSLLNRDYLEASQTFQVVAASPRTSKYAALAKLRLGDALFYQDRYAEATEVFRGFTNQYKSDPNLPYARFKVAQCYYERLPGEWFASPPAHEMDQTLTQQAEAELKGFLGQFPTSRYAPRARSMLESTRSMLLSHELYVVDFYADREQWQAVAWRLGEAMALYPELVSESRAWQLAIAWGKVGQQGETAKALAAYLDKHPGGAHEAEARSRLEALQKALEVRKPVAPPTEPTPKVEPVESDPEEPTDPVEPDEDEPEDDKLELRPPTLPPLDEP
ncbi:MAG: outer membrane protein assembly factor BamD [Deltaproteobacteria bacterium]|nr:outer membrane protein assembly factor BamD [Deltaproteobacteria bacterium]